MGSSPLPPKPPANAWPPAAPSPAPSAPGAPPDNQGGGFGAFAPGGAWDSGKGIPGQNNTGPKGAGPSQQSYEAALVGTGQLGTAFNQKYGPEGQPLPWESPEEYYARTGNDAFRPGDFDMRDPGALETAYTEQGAGYLDPTRADQYWEQVQGQAAPQTTQNTQDWFNQFNATPANLDPYYERARDRTATDINDAFAARGMFGSSAATGQLSDAMVGLSAEQANREADYGLAYQGMGGQFAAAADQNSAQAAGLGIQDMLGRGGLALGADEANRRNLDSYFEAAAGAQGARRTRAQDFFGNVAGASTAKAGLMGDAFESGFGSETDLFLQQQALELGIPVERLNQVYRGNEQFKSDITWGINTAGGAGDIYDSAKNR